MSAPANRQNCNGQEESGSEVPSPPNSRLPNLPGQPETISELVSPINWSLSPSPSQLPEANTANSRALVTDGLLAGASSSTKSQAVLPETCPGGDPTKMLALFESVILELHKNDTTFAEWLVFIFKPTRGAAAGDLRKEHFWQHTETVQKLLSSWTHTHQTKAGRNLVINWAIDFVASRMRSEAQQITNEGILRSSNKTIGPTYLKNFKLSAVKEVIQERCSVSAKVLLSMAGVDSSRTRLTEAPISAQNIVLFCLIALLREFSQQNNLIQVLFSLYMYATGLQRQAFEILAHLGLVVSYSLLVSGLGTSTSWKQRKHKNPPTSANEATAQRIKEPTAGPLKALSVGCIQQIKEVVKAGTPIGFVFDNINLVWKVAESSLGKIDAPMNGTCATAFELHGATKKALDQEEAQRAFMEASPLAPQNILLSHSERALHHRLMVHTILRIIIQHGGEYFAQYLPFLEASQPATDYLIKLHQTQTYPLPAMEIDEASIDGAIEVMNELYAAVGIDMTTETFKKKVQFVGGDLKSVSNLRGGKDSRAGHDNLEYSFGNVTFIIGLFHMLMTAMTGFLILHFGKPTAGVHNPGSLHFHNKLIERKPISITSPIPFTISKNLINVSLVARVIHCLTLVSGCVTLDEYASVLMELEDNSHAVQEAGQNLQKPWEQLVMDATKVYEKYTNIWTVDELRKQRKFAKSGQRAGDMVYENALVFLRDMLNLQEVRFSIKRGDPGRVLIILKVFALSFRGAGRTQYAHEILSLIHHIEKIWPGPLRNLVLQNWLINTTGRPDSWIGVDHHQEHGNLWIKASTIYKAHGSNASWSWLAAISPCVEALRTLAKDLNGMLGSYAGVLHTTPDLTMDILKIVNSLNAHNVYRLQLGRTFHGEDEPVLDAESVGLNSLLDGKPSVLTQYNDAFKATQEAHRRPIVSKMVHHTSLPRYPSGSEPSNTPGHTDCITVDRAQDLARNTVESESDEDEDELAGVEEESDEEQATTQNVDLEGEDSENTLQDGLIGVFDDEGER